MHSLLIKFIETKDIQVLLQYESDFKAHIKNLNPFQLTQLQIEYASALFKSLQYFTDEELANLQFNQLIQNQKIDEINKNKSVQNKEI